MQAEPINDSPSRLRRVHPIDPVINRITTSILLLAICLATYSQAEPIELLGPIESANVVPPTISEKGGTGQDGLRVKVEKAANSQDAQVLLKTVKKWEAGDDLVLTVEARAVGSSADSGEGWVDVGLQHSRPPHTLFFRGSGAIGKEWTTLEFLIKGMPEMEPGACMVFLDFGQCAQEIELRRVALTWDPAESKQRQARHQEPLASPYARRSERLPKVTHVSLVAPNILALEVEAQEVERVSLVRYEPEPGDQLQPQKRPDGTVKWSWVIREGKQFGRLHAQQWLTTPERLLGDPLLTDYADDAANFTITSTDDPAFENGINPLATYRKSKPSNIVLPGKGYTVTHRIYLELPEAIQADKHYKISIDKLNVQNPELNFIADLPQVRSEAVHVNQVGYRPDDPVKRAFLSVWLGSGGGYTFPEGLSFSLVDDASGRAVYKGKVEPVMAENGTEKLWNKPPKNYSQTAIYQMDFSGFNEPGRYRVYVEGVGCSYPFEIQDNVWQLAFLTQMKGLYNQRSGVELGPPYTSFKRPPDFHPNHGAVVTRSTYDALADGQYGRAFYKAVAEADTREPVPEAWGGYHDAGDWNPRRVTHMYTTLAQLELVELFPDYFNTLKLNIPSMEGVPDIITEALFEIDCFRRIQHEDGAVPFGIETSGDPLFGELSWLSNQHAYVLAPNIRDSWLYAAAAARAAKVLQPINAELAEVYLKSATRAFDWAERTYADMRASEGQLNKGKYWQAIDARNLSSLILYDITDDQRYHAVFKETTCLTNPNAEAVQWGLRIQSDAMFLYTRMDEAKVDGELLKNARKGIRKLAERSLDYARHNTFNITQREPGRPMFAGFFSTSGGMELVRAHYMTGEERYLAGAVQSCQFQLGCNPSNLVYTTGLGSNPVRNPLEVDARGSGQDVPVGLTVFGNTDYFNWPNSFWDMNLKFVNQREFLWPNAYEWPLTEAYFDVWILVSANEYVIDTWAPNVLVWGYLAARR